MIRVLVDASSMQRPAVARKPHPPLSESNMAFQYYSIPFRCSVLGKIGLFLCGIFAERVCHFRMRAGLEKLDI